MSNTVHSLRNIAVALIVVMLFVAQGNASPVPSVDNDLPLALSVPSLNTNGVFVVKVLSNLNQVYLQSSEFKLYRNFEGGEFELVESINRYSAISQVINKRGRYGYKAVMLVRGHGEELTFETASTSYIDVELRNYSLLEKSKNKPEQNEMVKILSQSN